MRSFRPTRLAVSLLLLITTLPSPAKTWQFEKNRDPLGLGYVAVANANLDSVTPMVRCWTADAAVDVRFSFNVKYRLHQQSQVALRFDNGRVQPVRWTPNPSGHALVVPTSAQARLLAQLRSARQLQLILTSVNGAEQTVQIPLDGSARAIDQAVAGCS